MFKAKRLTLKLEGVKEELTVLYRPLNALKVYLGEALLVPEPSTTGNYLIKGDTGELEKLSLHKGRISGCKAVFRGETIQLLTPLSNLEYAIGAIPLVIFIFFGALLGAVLGLLAVLSNYYYYALNREGGIMSRISFSFITTLMVYLLYLGLSLMLKQSLS